MRCKVLKAFPYSQNGIQSVELAEGAELDIRDELVPGLLEARLVETAPVVDPAIAAAEEAARLAKIADEEAAARAKILNAETALGLPEGWRESEDAAVIKLATDLGLKAKTKAAAIEAIDEAVAKTIA